MWKNISETSKTSQRLQGETKMNKCRTPSVMILKPRSTRVQSWLYIQTQTDIHQQAVLTPAVCVRSDRRGSGALLLAVWFHACSTCV